MEAELDTCILYARTANAEGECIAEQVGRYVVRMDHAAADGLGVMEFTDTWRDARRFGSAEAAQAFLEARSPFRPTVGGEPHCPAAVWSYGLIWVRDIAAAEVDMEMNDAVAEAAAYRGLRH